MSRTRKLLIGLFIALQFLFLANAAIEWAEGRGWLKTHSPDDAVQFVGRRVRGV